jgi:hypothetical protein
MDMVEFRPGHPRGLAIRMIKKLSWNADQPPTAVAVLAAGAEGRMSAPPAPGG